MCIPELQRLVALRPALRDWYRRRARDLPWRRTRDPYAIWVSEVMLQQTQVVTVRPYFERWMARFPTIWALSAAEEGAVLLAWEGLGYYSRARNLHRAAGEIVASHGGQVPRDPALFRALPGVGAYTTAAVQSIAFGADLAVFDGNVKRVLGRLVALDEPATGRGVLRRLEALAQALLPEGQAALHNQAMMELGALVCTPRAPRCETCPFSAVCAAHATGQPERYPPRPARRAVPHKDLAVAVLLDDEGRLLLYRRPHEGMLAGLWDLPAVEFEQAEPTEVAALLAAHVASRHALEIEVGAALPDVEHAYTHLRVTLHPRRCRLRRTASGEREASAARDQVWVTTDERAGHALPRASHKVLEFL